jgi:Ni2+-binding GTPase involved in maturation of urease and hydrogenase
VLTVCGPPSSGKTSVIIKTVEILRKNGVETGIIKMDCLATQDDITYKSRGFEVQVGLSEGLCPDHFFVSNIEACHTWGMEKGFDMLICESAGLCNRCSPHIKGVLGICVIDNLMGINTPKKIGPMLKFADIIVVTKGDIVSQAEREIFAFKILEVNPRCRLFHVNGITGQGASALAEVFMESEEISVLAQRELRYPMPSALCSYCLGETKIGDEYQMGNNYKMQIR